MHFTFPKNTSNISSISLIIHRQSCFIVIEIPIGRVTSGGYSPLLEGPIAMAYVATEYAKTGTKILAKMRGKDYPCEIVKMPFVTKDKAD